MFNFKNHKIYLFGFWALVAAVFVNLKAFMIPGCMAFDLTDDAMHTFVNLSSAQTIISHGKLPLINLLNNFGTPLIGDTLTYPFSFQSLLYWFLPFDVSMEISRFVFCFLTVWLLCLFFSKYMSKFTSIACAYMVMFDGGFVWHVIHHHYQASLFWCVLILILQEKFAVEKKFSFYLMLVFSHIALFLNTSINVALIMYPFFFFNLLCLSKFKNNRIFFLGLIAMLSGLLFSYPDISYFLLSAQESMRATQFYQEGPHYIVARRISILLLSMALVGVIRLWKEGKGWDAARLVLLGFLPLILISIVISEDHIWKAIPLIKSTDITRFWWVSNIFLAVGMGLGIDYLCKKTSPLFGWVSAVYLMVITEFCFSGRIILKASALHPHRASIFFALLFVLILCHMFFYRERQSPRTQKHFIFISLIIIGFQLTFAALQVFKYQYEGCRVYHQFSSQGSDRFQPASFVKVMKPYSRVAIDERTDLGRELKMTRDHLFSSAGRSVFQDKKFTQYLLDEELIEIDHYLYNYHFRQPWNANKLSDLGIRYVIQNKIDENLSQHGWTLQAADGESVLYENPVDTSLVYLIDPKGRKTKLEDNNVAFEGNGIKIKVPSISGSQNLVATFVAINGWRVSIDGERKKLTPKKDHLLRVDVSPNQKLVYFEFKPFEWYVYLFSVMSAVLIPVIAFMLLGRPREFCGE